MTVWAVSLTMAFAMVEVCTLVLANHWLRGQPIKLQNSLLAFLRVHSDDERQRLILQSGLITLRFSLVCAALVALLAAVVMVPTWFLKWEHDTLNKYLLITSVTATLWWRLRNHLMAKKITAGLEVYSHVYSRLDRCLHWLALEPMVVRQISFELERLYALPKQQVEKKEIPHQVKPAEGAVYVCGMARSGTTLLLTLLDQAPEFRSLNYRDMPFVMAPNLWRLLHKHSSREMMPTPRIHGDGVMVDYDSPEAFEEVFWRTFGYESTKQVAGSGGQDPDASTLASFADYRALITNPKTMQGSTARTHRYLSKNNNNILRIKALVADPAATVLLVYRDPIDTARSSFRLHQALGEAKADKFTLAYMGWLGHHEFGVGHMPLGIALQYMNRKLHPQDHNYWLDYWNAIYKHVLTQLGSRVILIDYDVLCQNPFAALTAINNKLGLNNNTKNLASLVRQGGSSKHASIEFDADLVNAAYVTYTKLKVAQGNILSIHEVHPLN